MSSPIVIEGNGNKEKKNSRLSLQSFQNFKFISKHFLKIRTRNFANNKQNKINKKQKIKQKSSKFVKTSETKIEFQPKTFTKILQKLVLFDSDLIRCKRKID